MRRAALLMVIALVAYLATGVLFVQPHELGVVRRFGAMQARLREPGPHFGLPWGWDRVDRLRPREVKQVNLGGQVAAESGVGASPLQFLTGDRNLVNVRATVQYTVADARQFLFSTEGIDPLVAGAAEAALSEVVAVEPVDRVLTLAKHELALRVAQQLQEQVDQYELGILVHSVDITEVEPPIEVADAFDRVISALRERERAINEAHSFSQRTLAEGRGEAQQTLDRGQAERDRLVLQALGESQRFESLLAQYERHPELTAQRLYLQTMSAILPRFRSKLIVDAGGDVDLSIFGEEKR